VELIDKKWNNRGKDEMVVTRDVKLGQLSRNRKPYLGILTFPYELQSAAVRSMAAAIHAAGELGKQRVFELEIVSQRVC